MIHVAAYVLLLAVTGSVAFAGGWQLNEHGARATGLGGAFVARAADPSAIYFNPAGLAFQKGFNLLAGATFILPSTKISAINGTTQTAEMESQIFYPPNLYVTYEFSDGLVGGLGVFTPFGLGSKYDKNWIGGQLSVETEVQTFYINPTIAYKLSDNFSVGAGVSFIYGAVTLNRRVPMYNTLTPQALPSGTYYIPSNPGLGDILLEGTGTGFGFNVGMIYKPTACLSFGASFRSETMLEFSGDAVFSGMGALASYFPGGEGTATLPMPMNFQAGVAYKISDALTAEVDFQYVGWSAYDKLELDLPAGPAINLIVGPPVPPSPLPQTATRVLQGPSSEDKLWEDGYLFRAGLEYVYNDCWTFRAGGLLDYTPQPTAKMEPMLPDANRVDLTLGVGYRMSKDVTLDLSYMIVMFEDRTSTYTPFKASYESVAHLIGFNIGYAL